MKIKFFLSLCLAGASAMCFAQGYKDGIEYYKADRFSNAKTLLERNLNDPSTDKSASYYYLGMIALQNKNVSEAKSYFQKGLEANPDYPYNYIGLGYLDLKNGERKIADKNFKEAESRGKKAAAVEVAIARAYYMADPVAYSKDIEKRLKKVETKNEPEYFMFLGDMAADRKNWGESAGYYEMATNYDPDLTEAYVKGADTYFQVNPDYAINLLNKLLQQNPQSALGQRELANTYYELNKYKEAAKEYGKYINNPNHFSSDEDRYAFLLFYGEDYNKGYEYATKLLSANPSNFSAMRFQFMNAAQLKDMSSQLLPMAEKLYAAHKADPKTNEFAPIDFLLIADEFARDKKYDEAEAVYNEAITAFPDNAAFDKNLAMMYIDANKLMDAAKAYKKYIAKNKSNDYNDFMQQAKLSYFAAISAKDSLPAESETFFNEAVEFGKKAEKDYPEMYGPAKLYGDVAKAKASKSDLASAAATYYQNAIDKLEQLEDKGRFARDAKELYNYMGNYYLEQKNVPKAKEYFEKYMIYDPDNADYRKFIDSLK